jgi:hypothetical protein
MVVGWNGLAFGVIGDLSGLGWLDQVPNRRSPGIDQQVLV